ncbi:MAG: hypothetical protein H7Y86_06450 [Rhizobacter sp.]|nr:hypothetical protein [Ferruginibacter sp.]
MSLNRTVVFLMCCSSVLFANAQVPDDTVEMLHKPDTALRIKNLNP